MRIAITATQLHAAALTAREEDAVAIEAACLEAGVTVLKSQPGAGRFKARETMAVAALGTLVRRHGADAGRFLRVLADAELAPIQANHIKAAELLLTDSEYAAGEPDDIAKTIKAMGDDAEREAKVFAATHAIPLWKALASIWFRKSPKRRRVTTTVADPKSTLDDVKHDSRRAHGEWAPGRYMRRCVTCDCRFEAALTARECADCAYQEDRHGQ